MNKIKYLKSLILIISIFSVPGQAQVEMELIDKGIGQYQTILIADFDFLQVGSVEQLFDIILTKTMTGSVTNAVMTIDLSLQQDGTSIAMIITKPFVMPDETGSWTISNQQLANQTFTFPGGETIRISESKLEDSASDLQDEILATSQIPTGTYILRNTLSYRFNNEQPLREVTTETPITIVVSNPTLINLITPGVFLNSGFKYSVYSDQPILQWNGNSGEYQALVFKKQSEFSTVEDILNSEPIWESPRLSMLSVQYPDFDAVPLVFGETYVWGILSFINTSSGENIIRSELWEFTLVDPSQALGIESMAKQELEQLLKQLLGNSADGVISEIDGFALSSMRVNGSTISIQELYRFIEKYRDEEHEIYDLLIRNSN